VHASLETGGLTILAVAGQALPVVLLFVSAFEGDDLCYISAAFCVGLAGTVAGFAGVFEIKPRTFFQYGVRIQVKCLGLILVAQGAIFVVDASGLWHDSLLGRGSLGRQLTETAGQNPPQGSRHGYHEDKSNTAWKRHFRLYRA
jgi:hypothetical protein